MILVIRTIFLLLFVGQVTLAGNALPDLGDASYQSISAKEEAKMGVLFMRKLQSKAELVSDPVVAEYIQRLGDQLRLHTDNPNQAFQFFVVNSSDVNAFAGPNGYVGIYSGLLLKTESESELAAVMAHEIAHVSLRHVARTIAEGRKMTVPVVAGMLASMALGAYTGGALATGAMTASMAGTLQHMINFTRDHEHDADRVGMQILYDAGYSPFSMPAFFKRLQAQARLLAERPPELLSTHPYTEKRIADAENRAAQFPLQLKNTHLGYELIKERLRIFAFKDFRAAYNYYLRRKSLTAAEQYGLALVYIEDHKYSDAKKMIASLQKRFPDQILYRLIEAENLSAQKNRTAALVHLEHELELYPHYVPLMIQYADVLLQSNQAKKAFMFLRKQLTVTPKQPHLIYQLSLSASRAGYPVEAYLARTDLFLLAGNKAGAKTQLKTALKLPSLDAVSKERLNARLSRLSAKSH